MANLTKEYQIMTDEEFKNIYTSEKFRNEVAFAHKCCDKHSNFKYYGTCTYPNENRRQVTEEQIKIAKELREQRKAEVLKENKNKLLFVGMGCNFEAKEGFINNHRIRTEFLNSEGKKYFIEVGTSRDPELMRCDHSIDRDLEDSYNSKLREYSQKIKEEEEKDVPNYQKIKDLRDQKDEFWKQPYNNFKGLERVEIGAYTYDNLLQLVNEKFNCNFKEVVIDYYNISCDGVICESPKK